MSHAATIQTNVSVVKQFIAAWDNRPLEKGVLEALVASEYVDYTRPQSDPLLADREVLIGLSEMLAVAFPDGTHELTLIEPVGREKVLMYWRFTGTHSGTFFGIPPTGRKVDFVGTDLLTVRGGKIVEHYHVEELLKAMAQLGVVSS